MSDAGNVLIIGRNSKTVGEIAELFGDIREFRVQVYGTAAEALWAKAPDIVLLTANSGTEKDIAEIRRHWVDTHIILLLDAATQNLSGIFRVAGANECLVQDDVYLSRIHQAVKHTMIRMGEKEHLASLDENLPEILFTLDLSGMVLHVNRTVTALLGYEPAEVLGGRLHDLFASDSFREKFDSYLRNAEEEIQFRDTGSFKNCIGVEEDFDLHCSYMDGDHVFVVARKRGLADGFDYAEEIDADNPADEPLPERLGRFRIADLLGAGGMGRVYLGMDQELERSVAIKVISKTLSEDEAYLSRFRQEARMLASLAHPNIAMIYEFGSDPSPYFCMEYLPGGSLRDMIRNNGVLPPDAAAFYTLQAALGLNEALSKNIIHLDVKPSNLMLSENRTLKVVDFGLARKIDPDRSESEIVGTPYYVAPELIQSGTADYRSDIYSLGITLFEMVYGFLPFYGRSITETFQLCLESELPARSALSPLVPLQLDTIIRTMTAKNPLQRYASYAELIFDLRAFLADRSMEKKPQPFAKPVQRLKGNLSTQPFAEVLAEIARKSLNGILTIDWMDIKNEVRFQSGRIVGIYSNQESARTGNPQERAMRILDRLFVQEIGSFVFEEGRFSGHNSLLLDSYEVLLGGVKNSMRLNFVDARIYNGRCSLSLAPDFQTLLTAFPGSARDVFLLFRIDGKVRYDQLLSVCGIAEKEFSRLVYLFRCLGVLEVTPELLMEKYPIYARGAGGFASTGTVN